MVPPKSQCIRLPGEEARELWLSDASGSWKRAEADDGRAGGLWGIECIGLDSAPFWSLSSKVRAREPGGDSPPCTGRRLV